MTATPSSNGEAAPQFLSVRDIARMLQISYFTARYLVRVKRVCPCVRIGRSIRVRRSALEAWLSEQEGDSQSQDIIRK
ncbi:MAG: helix-turn-helix domain-containing protein [Planctomycetota bacterium]